MFEILEHTADIGFRATGATREEMFEQAALALVSIAVELDQVALRAPYPLAATGEDLESLLVNWLNEVLYYLDAQRILLARFQVTRLEEQRVLGQAWGEPHDPARHAVKLVVKGVTYHQLKIGCEPGCHSAEVYLDV